MFHRVAKRGNEMIQVGWFRIWGAGALGFLLMSSLVACSGPQELSVVPPTQVPTATPVSPSPTTTVTAEIETPPAPSEEDTVGLKLVIMKRNPDNTITVLENGSQMTAGDLYSIFFQPEEDAYVYVLQQDSSKSIQVHFPNPENSDQTNPVPAGTEVWVPKDIKHWFFLDENVGQETMMVVAARERRPELEKLIGGVATKPGELASWLFSPDRGSGGVRKTEEKPIALSDGTKVDLIESIVEGSGDEFVYKLDFEHK